MCGISLCGIFVVSLWYLCGIRADTQVCPYEVSGQTLKVCPYAIFPSWEGLGVGPPSEEGTTHPLLIANCPFCILPAYLPIQEEKTHP